MSEHIRPEFLQLPIEDVEARICIGGIMETFSTADSAVWLFPEQFSLLNNVVRWEDDDSYSRWFSIPQADLDILHEAGITHIYPPYPNKETIAGWWAVEMAHLDYEIEELEDGTELL